MLQAISDVPVIAAGCSISSTSSTVGATSASTPPEPDWVSHAQPDCAAGGSLQVTPPIETAPKLLLTLGNNAVKMKVNGAKVNVSASSSSIGYELVPGSSKLLPTAQQPRCA